VDAAQTSVAQVSGSVDLCVTIVKALNDDRAAFAKVLDLVTTGTNIYQTALVETLNAVLFQQAQYKMPYNQMGIDWKSMGFNPDTNSVEGYVTMFNSLRGPVERTILLQTLSDQNRIPMTSKLGVYASILKSNESLRVLNKVCELVDNQAHLNLLFVQAPKYLEWVQNQRLTLLVSNYTSLIQSNRADSATYVKRGYLYETMSNFISAASDYKRAYTLDPENATNLNAYAWLLATSPNDEVRDGKLAFDLASKACKITHWSVWNYVGTLAAAYAEAGDFEQAIKYEDQAIATKGIPEEEAKAERRRLELFKQHQPTHEVPPWPADPWFD
jgi:tetratricopeptide (TPR) repeat protein